MKTLSLNELEEILNKQANEIPAVAEDGETLKRIKPSWHEPDANGCNWGVNSLTNEGYNTEIFSLIIKLQNQYRLDKQ